MSFDLLKVDKDVTNETKDTLPPKGSKFDPIATGVYPMVIKLAYFTESRGGATALNLVFKNADGTGPEVKQTMYVTSGTAKGKKNYYIDKKTGAKHTLPDMAKADGLHKLLADAPLADVDVEKKIIKLWNFDEKGEVNTEVNMAMSLLDKSLLVGIVKKRQNKRVQNDAGDWVDGPEPMELNEIDKFFDTEGRTLTERDAGEDAVFIKDWKERFPTTHVHDTFKELPGQAPAASKANGSAEPQKEVKSLF